MLCNGSIGETLFLLDLFPRNEKLPVLVGRAGCSCDTLGTYNCEIVRYTPTVTQRLIIRGSV
jgi:hypothetical protein